MTDREYDLDALIGDEPPANEPLSRKVDRLAEGTRGLLLAFTREKALSRRVRVIGFTLAAVVIVVAVAGVAFGVASYRQSRRLDDLLDDFIALQDQRRIDACERDNAVRTAGLLLVEYVEARDAAFVRALADPAVRAPTGVPLTPEQRRIIDEQIAAFDRVLADYTAEDRAEVLERITLRDCRPEALGNRG